MNSFARFTFVTLTCSIVLPAQAGPVTFFRRVFGHHETPPPQHRRKKAVTSPPLSPSPSPSPVVVNTDRPPDVPEVIEATPTPTPLPAQPASSVLPATKKLRTDFPYGIPVQGKPGFVTSPFSPNGGMVDVRGFASGTEVKDPYTGKIFITP